MTDMYAQGILKTSDGIPENYVTNTLSFDFTNSGANIDAATLNIKDFYDDINVAVFPSTMSQTGHIIKWYLHGGPRPNYPQKETGFSLATAPSSDPMPSEVALVASFQGIRIPGQDQRRKQGRIYLGQVKESANTSGGRVSGSVAATVAQAMEDFKSAVDTDTDGTWTVYSAANATSVEVDNGWVDDTWDTQRRRGLQVTARTLWP